MPVYWIGAYSLQAFSARSFFGSLLGWMFPFWFLLGHAWFYGEMELFTTPFLGMVRFDPFFQGLGVGQWVTLGYLAALLLVSGGYMLGYGRDEKIRTARPMWSSMSSCGQGCWSSWATCTSITVLDSVSIPQRSMFNS